MTRNIPTSNVQKDIYNNYWKKAQEYQEAMGKAMISKNWNAASLNAVHAGISANDAVLVFYHGIRSVSSKHADAVKLLRSLMKKDDAKIAATHLSKLIYSKNIIEYESRLFKQDEAYALTKHANKFLDWAKSVLPKQ